MNPPMWLSDSFFAASRDMPAAFFTKKEWEYIKNYDTLLLSPA